MPTSCLADGRSPNNTIESAVGTMTPRRENVDWSIAPLRLTLIWLNTMPAR